MNAEVMLINLDDDVQNVVVLVCFVHALGVAPMSFCVPTKVMNKVTDFENEIPSL